MLKGGYQIVDLKGKTLPATIAGTHALLTKVFGTTKKKVVLSGLAVSGFRRSGRGRIPDPLFHHVHHPRRRSYGHRNVRGPGHGHHHLRRKRSWK